MGKFKDWIEKVPNYAIALVMLLVFAVWVFFNKNIGYAAFSRQIGKIDTLNLKCDALRQQIASDSMILEALNDSALLDRYLHEKKLFVGKGETMYQIVDTTSIPEEK